MSDDQVNVDTPARSSDEDPQGAIVVDIEEELRRSYLGYAVSTLIAVSYTHLTLPTIYSV